MSRLPTLCFAIRLTTDSTSTTAARSILRHKTSRCEISLCATLLLPATTTESSCRESTTFSSKMCRFEIGERVVVAVDMVGCHRGLIQNSNFVHTNTANGGTTLQPKGGCKDIVFRANRIDLPRGSGRAVQRRIDWHTLLPICRWRVRVRGEPNRGRRECDHRRLISILVGEHRRRNFSPQRRKPTRAVGRENPERKPRQSNC